MYPPRMSRVAPMPFFFVLTVIITGLFVYQTNASLFIEVTDENALGSKITLYECSNVAKDTYITTNTPRTPRRYKTAPTPITPTSLRKSGDIVCTEVNDKKSKQDIYSKANFYLVTNGVLDGGKKILLTSKGKKGSRSPPVETPPPYSFLFGVTIMGAVPDDYPKFTAASQDKDVIKFLTEKTEATPLIANYLPDQKFEQFVDFLSVANFDTLLHPSEEVRDQFKVFSEVLKELEILYNRDVRNGKKNKVATKRSMEIHQQISAAVRLLIQKIVDPCLFLAAPKESNQNKKIVTRNEAEVHCNNYCRFLGVGFLSNRVVSKDCGSGRSLVYGECHLFRCVCEREWKTQILHKRKQWPSEYHDMIKCSNELRVGIAELTPKTKSAALASLSSLQKTFSRGWSRRSSGRSADGNGNRSPSRKFPQDEK